MNSVRTFRKKIGVGGRGVVYLGYEEDLGHFAAIKEIPYLELSGCSPSREGESDDSKLASLESESQAALIMAEIRLMQRSMHPNLARYYGARRSVVGVQIIMEYVGGGSLEALLKLNGGPLRESVVRRYATDILNGLAYLHEELRACHRDIKPANVLLTPEGQCKLTDFGTSKALSTADGSSVFLYTTVGTPWYMAPEVISGGVEDGDEASSDSRLSDESQASGSSTSRDRAPLRAYFNPLHGIVHHTGGAVATARGYTTSADIWSLGVTVYEMITGTRPFGGTATNPTAVLFSIASSATRSPQLPAHCAASQELQSFLDLCFVYDKNLRPSARELLTHCWIANDTSDSTALSTQLPALSSSKTHSSPHPPANASRGASSRFCGVPLLDAVDLPNTVGEWERLSSSRSLSNSGSRQSHGSPLVAPSGNQRVSRQVSLGTPKKWRTSGGPGSGLLSAAISPLTLASENSSPLSGRGLRGSKASSPSCGSNSNTSRARGKSTAATSLGAPRQSVTLVRPPPLPSHKSTAKRKSTRL